MCCGYLCSTNLFAKHESCQPQCSTCAVSSCASVGRTFLPCRACSFVGDSSHLKLLHLLPLPALLSERQGLKHNKPAGAAATMAEQAGPETDTSCPLLLLLHPVCP